MEKHQSIKGNPKRTEKYREKRMIGEEEKRGIFNMPTYLVNLGIEKSRQSERLCR